MFLEKIIACEIFSRGYKTFQARQFGRCIVDSAPVYPMACFLPNMRRKEKYGDDLIRDWDTTVRCCSHVTPFPLIFLPIVANLRSYAVTGQDCLPSTDLFVTFTAVPSILCTEAGFPRWGNLSRLWDYGPFVVQNECKDRQRVLLIAEWNSIGGRPLNKLSIYTSVVACISIR